MMMQAHQGKKDVSECGSTVLELKHMLTTCGRMSEMGEFSTCLKFMIHAHLMSFFVAFRWVLLEVLDKLAPGSVTWKQATKPPIKMPFRKVENCNQVVRIGKELNFSLVNVAGDDIVSGNKKLIIGLYPCIFFCF